ncbi:REPTOR-binding partner [Onthophagus taurus]|uniref:REPTOR-binding partner n=1 Tax=Onthophagus taurus TaxID=166361 RepID=UPI000C1FF783|nr:cAMP-responsive element-binding protein-like 2 [Onthophagus taurus]
MDMMEFQEMTVIPENPVNEGPHRKESGKRGRKPGRKSSEKVDMKAKLERSRQSARECRARKKLRYQYLEELVADREKAVLALRKELDKYQSWAKEIDAGHIPEGMQEEILDDLGNLKQDS